MLNEREEKIKKGVADAESAERSLSEADSEKQAILATAHKDAEGVSSKAKVYAEEKSEEIVAEAHAKAEAVIRAAEAKGLDIKSQAEKESEAEIAKLAILAAEKVLREKSV